MTRPGTVVREGAVNTFATRKLSKSPDAIAPDGSEVRLLATIAAGSMAHFTLRQGMVSRAVVHRSVEELWFFIAGRGRMWRRQDGAEEIVEVHTGVSISIPVGTAFQFRADGEDALEAVGVTMPPWPGPHEASFVDGAWPPTA
jgi:mannose-6-phosphate isomerase-like protein (cupin superfamily)